MGDAVLDIKNLSKRYNSKWALKKYKPAPG